VQFGIPTDEARQDRRAVIDLPGVILRQGCHLPRADTIDAAVSDIDDAHMPPGEDECRKRRLHAVLSFRT
jgi:hypothetical protein